MPMQSNINVAIVILLIYRAICLLNKLSVPLGFRTPLHVNRTDP